MRPSVTFLNVWFLPQSYPNLLNRNKTQSKSFLNSKRKIQRFSFQLLHSTEDLSESLCLPSSNENWALSCLQCMPLSVNSPLLLSCVRLPAQCQILKGFSITCACSGLDLVSLVSSGKISQCCVSGSICWLQMLSVLLQALKWRDFQSAPSVLFVSQVYLNLKVGTQNHVIIWKNPCPWISPFL